MLFRRHRRTWRGFLARRWTDWVGQGILVSLLATLIIGYLHAQLHAQTMVLPSAVAEAVLDARLMAVMDRVSKLETMQQYALVAIVGNLIAHLFQISRGSGRRTG